MACKLDASCVSTCCCWSPGKASTILSTVWAASGVCRVAITKWPVSAAVKAVEIVSKSRISPTPITSGSWRKICTKAPLKERVSECTCCCTMRLRRFSWTYSTGSSTVMILQRRCRLIMSSRQLNVVVLPLPVGPVTKINPLRFSTNLLNNLRQAQLFVANAD